MFLAPGLRPLEKEQAKLIGKRFQLLRLQRGLLIPEVASLMGRETSIVLHIDSVRMFRHSGVKQVRLHDYVRYADILGYSLCEIFDETSLQDLLMPASEEQLLEQAEQAIHQLKARSKPILPGTIADLMAMSKSRLKRYPRIKKLLNKWEQERKRERFLLGSKREDTLIKQIEPILQQLEACGEPLVLERVCHLVGLTYRWTIRKYPRIKALFQVSTPAYFWLCLTFRDSETRWDTCADENSQQEPIGLLSFLIYARAFTESETEPIIRR